MYANERSKVGWIAIGWDVASRQWATSEWVYADKKQAISNLQWCYNVAEDSLKAIKVGLK
jgi:hypothetical protein